MPDAHRDGSLAVSTQRIVDEHHVSFALDGIDSALSYLPPVNAAVQEIRDALRRAQHLLVNLQTPAEPEPEPEADE